MIAGGTTDGGSCIRVVLTISGLSLITSPDSVSLRRVPQWQQTGNTSCNPDYSPSKQNAVKGCLKTWAVWLLGAGPEERKPAESLLVDGQKYAVVGYVSTKTNHTVDVRRRLKIHLNVKRVSVSAGRFCCWSGSFWNTVSVSTTSHPSPPTCWRVYRTSSRSEAPRWLGLRSVLTSFLCFRPSLFYLNIKLLLCFCSTSTPGAASWSWEPELCRSSVSRPSPPKTSVRPAALTPVWAHSFEGNSHHLMESRWTEEAVDLF